METEAACLSRGGPPVAPERSGDGRGAGGSRRDGKDCYRFQTVAGEGLRPVSSGRRAGQEPPRGAISWKWRPAGS